MADTSRKKFIAEKEALYGGTLQFSFLCTYYGSDTQLRQKPLAGMLYRAGLMTVFEDFEKSDTVFGFTTRGDSEQPFEKTLIEIPCSQIEKTIRLRESDLADLLQSAAGDRKNYVPRRGLFDFLHYQLLVLLMKDGSFQVFDTLGNWNADFCA